MINNWRPNILFFLILLFLIFFIGCQKVTTEHTVRVEYSNDGGLSFYESMTYCNHNDIPLIANGGAYKYVFKAKNGDRLEFGISSGCRVVKLPNGNGIVRCSNNIVDVYVDGELHWSYKELGSGLRKSMTLSNI